MSAQLPPFDSLPTHVPSAAVAGQVDLILDGVDGPDRTATVRVPADIGKRAEGAGRLLLCDEEGAPFAQLSLAAQGADDAVTLGTSPPGPDETDVNGTLTRLGDTHARPFAALRRTPDEFRADLGGAPALAVSTTRPLLRAEAADLVVAAAAQSARVAVLPLTAAPGYPPADVLVRAIQADAELLTTPAGEALVVPLPIAEPSQGVAPFVAAAGATLQGHVSPDGWSAISAALGSGGPLDDLVGTGAAAVLTRWRPPRGERGLTVFFTGLSGSGKSTVARGVAETIRDRGRTVTSVDGDVARRLLSAGLTFSRADRDLNIKRLGWVASEISRHRGVAICAPIAPYAATRASARAMVEANGDFVLVYISTPLEVCEARDRKGLYARARAGLIENFTGISDPYEVPDDADVVLDTSSMSVHDAVTRVVEHLERGGWLTTAE